MRFSNGRGRNRLVSTVSSVLIVINLASVNANAACCCCGSYISAAAATLNQTTQTIAQAQSDALETMAEEYAAALEENKNRTGSTYSSTSYPGKFKKLSDVDYETLYDADYHVNYALNYLKSKELYVLQQTINRQSVEYDIQEIGIRAGVNEASLSMNKVESKLKKSVSENLKKVDKRR